MVADDGVVLVSCSLLEANVAGVAIELLISNDGPMLLLIIIGDDGDGVFGVPPAQFSFISLAQIVTLVQLNTPGSKLKSLMRLSCID